MSQGNQCRFLNYIPLEIKDLFDSDFEKDVCSICVSALENYKSLIRINPNIQDIKYVGLCWRNMICRNSKNFEEPDTSWIDYKSTINKNNTRL